MREIKFRAWDGFYRRMVLVDELHIKTNEIRYSQGFNTLNKFVLMQYTGLKDINGVEIYEGDVARLEDGDFEVCFLEGCWYLRRVTTFGTSFGRLWEVSAEAQSKSLPFEVIGNIYENPELIDGQS